MLAGITGALARRATAVQIAASPGNAGASIIPAFQMGASAGTSSTLRSAAVAARTAHSDAGTIHALQVSAASTAASAIATGIGITSAGVHHTRRTATTVVVAGARPAFRSAAVAARTAHSDAGTIHALQVSAASVLNSKRGAA